MAVGVLHLLTAGGGCVHLWDLPSCLPPAVPPLASVPVSVAAWSTRPMKEQTDISWTEAVSLSSLFHSTPTPQCSLTFLPHSPKDVGQEQLTGINVIPWDRPGDGKYSFFFFFLFFSFSETQIVNIWGFCHKVHPNYSLSLSPLSYGLADPWCRALHDHRLTQLNWTCFQISGNYFAFRLAKWWRFHCVT